jgi:hypothetical protein
MELVSDALAGGLNQAWLMARVVIPLMIVLQFCRDLNLLGGLARLMSPLTRLFGMSGKSAFPLLIGLIFGLSFGAGVIFDSAREDGLSRRDLLLLVIFLVGCHAVVEDTLVFVVVGADGRLLLAARIGVALAVTWLISLFLKPSSTPALPKGLTEDGKSL